jgi:hypothetical protein
MAESDSIKLCGCGCGQPVGRYQGKLNAYLRNHSQRVLKPNKTHGLKHHALYRTWLGMMNRCLNPKNRGWPAYGGRGITVCERWRNISNFIVDMGERPPRTSLDRIDYDGNYEPGNCRWATHKEQAINRRSTVFITYDGQTNSMSDWARFAGIEVHTLIRRIYSGWTIEKALTTPVRRSARHPRSLRLDK